MTISTELTTKEILIKIKKLLSDRENWCQRSYALDENGGDTGMFSRKACKWCALGATYKTTHENKSTEKDHLIVRLLDKISSELYKDDIDIVHVNDHLGYDQVMKVFDTAIERAE